MARTPRIVASLAGDARSGVHESSASAVRAAGTLLRDEHQRAGKLVQEGLERGPVAAYGRVVRGEIDAPVAVQFVTLSWLPGTGSMAGVWCALLASIVTVPLVLLAATDVVTQAPLPVQMVVIGLFAIVTLAVCGILYALVLGRSRPKLMQHVAAWSALDKLYWVALIIVVPTVGFATVTTFGIRHDLLGLADAHPRDADLPFAVFGTYLRSLAGAVPLLDIPSTLDWKPGLRFDAWYGNLLVLLYKIALIVPLLQLLSLLLKRLFGDAPAPVTDRAG
jgi:hypothetical protein